MNNLQSAIEHNALILGGVGISIAVIQVIFVYSDLKYFQISYNFKYILYI